MIVSEWETLYEETYGTQHEVTGPSFVGWNSSYTGQPIPEDQMQEWLTSTVESDQALSRSKCWRLAAAWDCCCSTWPHNAQCTLEQISQPLRLSNCGSG